MNQNEIAERVAYSEKQWEQATRLIESGDSLVKILQQDLDRVQKAVDAAQRQLKGAQRAGAGRTISPDIIDAHIIPALRTMNSTVHGLFEQAKATVK